MYFFCQKSLFCIFFYCFVDHTMKKKFVTNFGPIIFFRYFHYFLEHMPNHFSTIGNIYTASLSKWVNKRIITFLLNFVQVTTFWIYKFFIFESAYVPFFNYDKYWENYSGFLFCFERCWTWKGKIVNLYYQQNWLQ